MGRRSLPLVRSWLTLTFSEGMLNRKYTEGASSPASLERKMQTQTLYIIRGLPGSGKSTKGEALTPGRCFAADDFFYLLGGGTYAFDPRRLGEAHAHCQASVEAAMRDGGHVSVANTFTQRWEVKPYRVLARRYGYTVQVIHMTEDYGSVHNVPAAAIARMRERWEAVV